MFSTRNGWVEEYGDRWFYTDGEIHRLDGPAMIRCNGETGWFYQGQRCEAVVDERLIVVKQNGGTIWLLDGKIVLPGMMPEGVVLLEQEPWVEFRTASARLIWQAERYGREAG